MQPDGWVIGSGGILLWLACSVYVSVAEKDWKPVVLFGMLPILAGLLLKGLA